MAKFKSSDRAMLLSSRSNSRGRPSPVTYEFENLEVGESFPVPYGLVLSASLRNKASVVGKKLGKQFSVIDHGQERGYEIARLK